MDQAGNFYDITWFGEITKNKQTENSVCLFFSEQEILKKLYEINFNFIDSKYKEFFINSRKDIIRMKLLINLVKI